MIIGSLLLIVVAVGLLVVGLLQGSDAVLGASIGASLLAAVALVVVGRQAAATRSAPVPGLAGAVPSEHYDPMESRLDRDEFDLTGEHAEGDLAGVPGLSGERLAVPAGVRAGFASGAEAGADDTATLVPVRDASELQPVHVAEYPAVADREAVAGPGQLGREAMIEPIQPDREAVTGSVQRDRGVAAGTIQPDREAVTESVQRDREAAAGSKQPDREAVTETVQRDREAAAGTIQPDGEAVTGSVQRDRGVAAGSIQPDLGGVIGSVQPDPEGVAGSVQAGRDTAGQDAAPDGDDGYDDADPVDEPPVQPSSAADSARVAAMDAEVLVVDGRPRYHVPGCPHLFGRRSEPLPAREAVELGFTPCSVCSPNDVLLTRAGPV